MAIFLQTTRKKGDRQMPTSPFQVPTYGKGFPLFSGLTHGTDYPLFPVPIYGSDFPLERR